MGSATENVMADYTLKEIERRVQHVKSVNGERDVMMDRLLPYYFIDHPTAGKQEREKVEIIKLPDGPNAVDLVQDLFAHAGFTLDVPAASESAPDRDVAHTAEKYLRTIIKQSERSQRMPLLGTAGLVSCDAWLGGWTCVPGHGLARQKAGR